MAPFYKAIEISSSSAIPGEDTRVYTGYVDSEWAVGVIPNGGYILAIILEACIRHQAQGSEHTDPIHITAHYLGQSSISQFEVHIRTIKTGKTFTNLSADFIQQGVSRVTTHAIFGRNQPSSDGTHSKLTLTPPSPYARRIPLNVHPSKLTPSHLSRPWTFDKQIRLAGDPVILSKNQLENRIIENAKHPAPEANAACQKSSQTFVGGDGLEWGAWFEFVSKEERISSPYLAFLVDIFLNIPSLLPKSERPGLTTSWFPTVVMAVEFKWPIPQTSSAFHSSRTVGLYSTGKFMTHPQSRHDGYVEVWSAPCNIGETGQEGDDWRNKQICLAVATQMALTIPRDVNQARGRKQSPMQRTLDKARL